MTGLLCSAFPRRTKAHIQNCQLLGRITQHGAPLTAFPEYVQVLIVHRQVKIVDVKLEHFAFL